jgi:hypothetical protein
LLEEHDRLLDRARPAPVEQQLPLQEKRMGSGIGGLSPGRSCRGRRAERSQQGGRDGARDLVLPANTFVSGRSYFSVQRTAPSPADSSVTLMRRSSPACWTAPVSSQPTPSSLAIASSSRPLD